MRTRSLVLLLAASCSVSHDRLDAELTDTGSPVEATVDAAVATAPVDVPADFEAAPDESPRLDARHLPTDLHRRIDTWFAGHGTRRLHVQLDRPLYRPGESVWIKSWSVTTRGLAADANASVAYALVDPRGVVVETKQVQQSTGTATNDFVLDASAPGGRWTVRATLPTGEVDERPFVVASYQAPLLRKTLEFAREGYGPGDRVEALVAIERSTGRPLADHPVQALLQVAGQTVLQTELRTDATGAVFVSAALPADLSSSDGLLTVIVEDGGITESISRSVPIVLADLSLAFFPEGGDLVAGLPGRVYFAGTDAHGEPADVTGVIVDDRGVEVATFRSVHDGLGRFAFTPEPGRRYAAKVTAPVGLTDTIPLPHALPTGCALRAFDDVRSLAPEVRVAVRCATPTRVIVSAVLRESPLDLAAVEAGPDRDTVVYLRVPEARALEQGAVRVTVFDRDLHALAERLVYRNPGRDLQIALDTDRDQYGPRDEVVLTVTTTDPAGRPVPAELALAVVDDAVIGLADDEEGHILSRLYLEPELVDSPDDPAWYFDRDEVLAARGLDLVMGTKGWRRFEWYRVWAPVPEVVTEASGGRGRWARVLPEERLAAAPIPMPAVADPAPLAEPEADVDRWDEDLALPPAREEAAAEAAADVFGALADLEVDPRDRRGIDGVIGLGEFGGFGVETWASVRVFPTPDYRAGFSGTRTDFRDTVFWAPTVNTDAQGAAEVRFYLSDAVTSFRITAEGLGQGAAGHEEATFASVLPVHLSTRLPVAVSAGDTLLLPITVSNARDATLGVDVSGTVDSPLVRASNTTGRLTLEPDRSATHWIPVEIGTGSGTATVRLTAEGGGLSDTVERELSIVPPGFPRGWSAAGQLDGALTLTMHLDEAVDGSLAARVSWQPSTVATLIGGMEGLIRTPGGCFEQTSSTNWPNVAILGYLEAHDGDPRLRMQSMRHLDTGYGILTGYQVAGGGFETFGSGPGKEALSAFGLLQFRDMQKVYPVDDRVLSRDVAYLLAQRDGTGGFRNSGESAHGYGSAPAPVLNGFITWALVSAGQGDALKAEIAHQADVADRTDDPYVLALATRSLIATGHPKAAAAARRLSELQAPDGSFPGAASSITRSHEANLLVESTALAALALMESSAHRGGADKAISWLIDNRQGAGTWGATQATALALSALTTHAEGSRRPKVGGELSIEVNGRAFGSLAYQADQSEPLVIDGWQDLLRTGENTIVLRQLKGDPLPFTVDVAWTSITPDTAPGAELGLTTRLSDTTVSMGDTVRLTATVANQTDAVVPSPIARIGLPAGLEAQTWQLEQLQERGEIAFFETRPREVTLYWDGVHQGAAHAVVLDLVATVPGVFTGPASSAYPYYDDDEKAWDGGLVVRIER